jgi:hypothetical protein
MEYSKKRRAIPAQNKKVARMDWMTKLVSADGGDAGVAIVDARPLKRIAQNIWPARPCSGKRRWSARKNPRCARPLVSGW